MIIRIKQSKRNNQWRVYLYGKNGEKLVWSEQYTTLQNAKHCAKLIKGKNNWQVIQLDKTGDIEFLDNL